VTQALPLLDLHGARRANWQIARKVQISLCLPTFPEGRLGIVPISVASGGRNRPMSMSEVLHTVSNET
jgi:hypothetical protein